MLYDSYKRPLRNEIVVIVCILYVASDQMCVFELQKL